MNNHIKLIKFLYISMVCTLVGGCALQNSQGFAEDLFKNHKTQLVQIVAKVENCHNDSYVNGLSTFLPEKDNHKECLSKYSINNISNQLIKLNIEYVKFGGGKISGIVGFTIRDRSFIIPGPYGTILWVKASMSAMQVKDGGYVPLEKCPCHWIFRDS